MKDKPIRKRSIIANEVIQELEDKLREAIEEQFGERGRTLAFAWSAVFATEEGENLALHSTAFMMLEPGITELDPENKKMAVKDLKNMLCSGIKNIKNVGG